MRITAALALGAFGCSGAVELDVALAPDTDGPPVKIDTRCDNGGCEGGALVDLLVSIKDDDRPAATVDILQYRVSHELTSIDGQPPYFADEIQVSVSVGTLATVGVQVAGARQREWVLARAGYDRADGTATITLAGYDQDDELVYGEIDFAIAFGDFASDAGSEGEESDGGTP